MLKQAFYSYWKQLRHPKLYKGIRNYTIIILFLLWFVFPYSIKINIREELAGYRMSLCIPILMVILLKQFSQSQMSKVMFLVPMNQADRERYVKALFGIQITVPVLLGVGIDFLWRLRYGDSMINLGFTILLYFSYAISEYLCISYTYPTGDTILHGIRTRSGTVSYAIPNIINTFAVYLVLFGATLDPYRENPLFLGETVEDYAMFLNILWIVMIVLDIYILVRYFGMILKEYCDAPFDIKR